jgi:hypothetical protein
MRFGASAIDQRPMQGDARTMPEEKEKAFEYIHRIPRDCGGPPNAVGFMRWLGRDSGFAIQQPRE